MNMQIILADSSHQAQTGLYTHKEKLHQFHMYITLSQLISDVWLLFGKSRKGRIRKSFSWTYRQIVTITQEDSNLRLQIVLRYLESVLYAVLMRVERLFSS